MNVDIKSIQSIIACFLLDKALVCNGNNDCLNNLDEENCPEFTCPTGFFKCAIDRLCINATKRCDGTYDCPSYTDEQNCRSTPTRRYCRENEFECSPASQSSGSSASRSPSCIPRSWGTIIHIATIKRFFIQFFILNS